MAIQNTRLGNYYAAQNAQGGYVAPVAPPQAYYPPQPAPQYYPPQYYPQGNVQAQIQNVTNQVGQVVNSLAQQAQGLAQQFQGLFNGNNSPFRR